MDLERVKIDYPHLLTCKAKKQENISKFKLAKLEAIPAVS
jgi:hypothetical protein